MRGWTYLLSGLLLWTFHFFTLYVVASVFLTTMLARMLALVVTVVCLGLGAVLLAKFSRSDAGSPSDQWMRAVALGGLAISGVAIVWQALPAILA
ncbi:hypothetical protein [Sphingomonas sp. ID0503]|uniref:hypothetical protein n=1 Tax=Sphingomonas sp. ID0503 TaxID=3399691 RepID=UPI003AFA664D